MSLNQTDQDALNRALEVTRGEDTGRRQQIDSMLADRPWEEVARFASYCAQGRALDLMPWQLPPSSISLDRALRAPFGGGHGLREAGELLKRLLDADLSKYEPDPLGALERVEAEKKRRPAM